MKILTKILLLVTLLLIIIILLWIELIFPKNKLLDYYEATRCTNYYFVNCLPDSIQTFKINDDDKKYISQTHNGLLSKQFIFIYDDKETLDKISIDYIDLKFTFNIKASFWEVTSYQHVDSTVYLSQESREDIKAKLFNQYKHKRIKITGNDLKNDDKSNTLNLEESKYFEKTYVVPHNFIGNDQYTDLETSLKYFTSNSYFGLWRQNESERISFMNVLDIKREYKWVNNIQGDNLTFYKVK